MAVASDFIFVYDGLAGEFPLGEGPIFAGDFFVFQEAVENGEDKGIFGKQDSAAGFFVQSVDDIAGLSDIAWYMVEQSDFCRIIAVAFHAVRLIDNDEMFVLIELLN